MSDRMLVIGLGYSGAAIARAAAAGGFDVTGTCRDPTRVPAGTPAIAFEEAAAAIAAATHLVVTAPPGPEGDPVLARHGAALARAGALRWIGYMSTTGVYGDHDGGWVDETTPAMPAKGRSLTRRAAERGWEAVAAARGVALDLLRTGGIYGPGRSVVEDLLAGRARQVVKPGHAFSRIHRDDIAAAVVAAARRPGPAGVARVLHLVDDEPAESASVVEAAAELLGLPVPPAIPYAEAVEAMSPMARSFWSESRRVANGRTRAALGLSWRYPTYREGLRQIVAEAGR
ncbi:SDR family NAD(P)-dependent oxidoreductase [Roseomonas sp. OT10]|uniref:SDR family NAD(P)-dependent oxidoreductase n=1 Tax=Roseomonas cutis TaxID=2897332 RepID=UPI001E42989F|nr:SDR family NAD(P)-dependent oxidoreductase [Roseomonas sp. OT10]UFN47384.1 SDR family NAD(P)-dependent oxidoreductase [Roseomonas sp. OT10]